MSYTIISDRATASFVYDADGNRVKSTVDGVTTVYIAGVFEFIENGATDKMTTYYDGNAMRRSGYGIDDGVFYLLQDHLKSSSSFVDQSGATLANTYYFPYGGNRGGAFSNLTTKRFTGQYHESSLPGGEGLSYYGARWYDAKLGRFLSADTIVPKPTNPQALNRYSYGYGSPLRYIDPSGHDPLNANWEAGFVKKYGQAPTDQDRRDRLFSLMFPGHGYAGIWLQEDWDYYYANRNALWKGKTPWPGEMEPSLERFATHVERLVKHYKPNETLQFVNAFAFVFGSIPLGYPIPASADMIYPDDNFALYPSLEEGEAGWNPALLDSDGNQSHHYAGLFHTGFYYGSWTGIAVNWLRDGPYSDYNQADLNLGDGAARQGWELFRGYYTIYQLPDTLRVSLSEQPYLLSPGYPR